MSFKNQNRVFKAHKQLMVCNYFGQGTVVASTWMSPKFFFFIFFFFDLKFVYFTVKKKLHLRNIEQNTGKR